MFKKVFLMVALVGGFALMGSAEAQARRRGVVVHRRPVAPVRRVVARTVLPPYAVGRRVVAGPVVHHRAYYPAYPVYTHYPAVYGRGVSVTVGH